MKTYIPSANAIEKKWYVVDATDMTLGRLASEVAKILRGKHKPTYTPFLDTG
ncbi:MAG: uL13 family ribosomal protein, partial [Lachnospiraceae bacterium]|nr:uL13 family ribosomal protein [Lachnospiraceae bacterium]